MLKSARDELAAEHKLLLLGAGESGKSTIFKQLKILHCHGFSADERAAFKPLIHANVFVAMHALLAFADERGLSLRSDEARNAAAAVLQMPAHDSELTPARASLVELLWRDGGVQAAYARRSEFQLIDSAQFFFEHVQRIAAADFVPTDGDILTTRLRTTGIVELEFTLQRAKFRVMDVGGQRSERKKWIHCFPAADAQLLTNRGFLFLDDVLASVDWRPQPHDGTPVVSDWRGLRVASYDARARRLVYRTPRRLVVVAERQQQRLVSFAGAAVDVVCTDEHQLYVSTSNSGGGGKADFRKLTAAALLRKRAVVETATFLTAADGGVAREQPLRVAARDLAAYGRSLARGEVARIGAWALEQLDGPASRRVAQAWLRASGRDGALHCASAQLRDDAVRLLLHAGFAATFEQRGGAWLVRCSERRDVDSSVRLCDASQTSEATRTWCFDMSSAAHVNDGFVVVRRARAVDAATRLVLSASLPTVQGNCFQDVTAVMFVAALSGFDLQLMECKHRNRMIESIELFGEIVNSVWFQNTAIVLFLNKADLFREKIERKVPLRLFPHFTGELTYENALSFIRAEYLQRNHDSGKQIYPHVTQATDTSNIKFVWDAVVDITLRNQITDMGLTL
jgi:hypothetical protein